MKFYGVFEASYPDGSRTIGYYRSKELAESVLRQHERAHERALFSYSLVEYETVD